MSVAKSYAEALYEAATEQKVDSAFFSKAESQMHEFCSLLDRSQELKTAFLAPITTIQEKIEMTREVGEKLGFSTLLSQFFKLLIQKKRLSLLSEICRHFSVVRLVREGGVPGQLVSAEPIDEQSLNILAKVFSQKLGKKVTFQVSTDPLLLAGVKVTLNGVTYDGTLRSQLQKLRDCFVTR